MAFWIVVNIAVTVFLIVGVRKFLLTLYLLIEFILLVQPAIIEVLFGAVHPKHGLDPQVYESALAFTAIYNLILGLSFRFFHKSLPMFGFLRRYLTTNGIDRLVRPSPVVLSSFVVLCVVVAAKFALDSYGAFRMLEEVEQSPFLQILKAFGTFDICLLIFLGEFKIARSQGKWTLNALYAVVAAIALIWRSTAAHVSRS